jgi:hypothetical protein
VDIDVPANVPLLRYFKDNCTSKPRRSISPGSAMPA